MMADPDPHHYHPMINIKFSLKGLKKTLNVACTDASLTWKEFITSKCKIPFEDDYIIQRFIVDNKSKKTEKMIFSGDGKVADFLSSFKRNTGKHRVTVIKRPKKLQASTETATNARNVNVNDEQPSTSDANIIRRKIKGNSPPLVTLEKRGPVASKISKSSTPAPIKNEKARTNGLSASAGGPRRHLFNLPKHNVTATNSGRTNGLSASAGGQRTDLFNLPKHNTTATNSANSKLIRALQRSGASSEGLNGINCYNEDNFASASQVGDNLDMDVDDNMSVVSQTSQDSQEDSSLVDIKAVVIQRWVKYFSNTDFHRMVAEHRKLKSGGRILKLIRLLPFTASCLQNVLEEPFKN